MSKSTDLAAGLAELTKGRAGGTVPRVIALFGDQPDVLEQICSARRDRGCSFAQIADYFTKNGHPIGEGAIKKYLITQGID